MISVEAQMKNANLYTLDGCRIIPDNPVQALTLVWMHEAGAFGGPGGQVAFERGDVLVFPTENDARSAFEELRDHTTA